MPNAPARPPDLSLHLGGLTLPDAALVLSKAGGKTITEEMLREDIGAGAPLNADGTLNLVHYAAWLVKETAHAD